MKKISCGVSKRTAGTSVTSKCTVVSLCSTPVTVNSWGNTDESVWSFTGKGYTLLISARKKRHFNKKSDADIVSTSGRGNPFVKIRLLNSSHRRSGCTKKASGSISNSFPRHCKTCAGHARAQHCLHVGVAQHRRNVDLLFEHRHDLIFFSPIGSFRDRVGSGHLAIFKLRSNEVTSVLFQPKAKKQNKVKRTLSCPSHYMIFSFLP